MDGQAGRDCWRVDRITRKRGATVHAAQAPYGPRVIRFEDGAERAEIATSPGMGTDGAQNRPAPQPARRAWARLRSTCPRLSGRERQCRV